MQKFRVPSANNFPKLGNKEHEECVPTAALVAELDGSLGTVQTLAKTFRGVLDGKLLAERQAIAAGMFTSSFSGFSSLLESTLQFRFDL
jgi:hypothetical protein